MTEYSTKDGKPVDVYLGTDIDWRPEAERMRTFDTGATRDTDAGKLDYEGFLSPLVLRRYAEYMHQHRTQSDGALRDSDNWQKGIPLDAYMKSGWRHFMDWWGYHRHIILSNQRVEDALCAIIFNASGYLHQLLTGKLSKLPLSAEARTSAYPNRRPHRLPPEPADAL